MDRQGKSHSDIMGTQGTREDRQWDQPLHLHFRLAALETDPAAARVPSGGLLAVPGCPPEQAKHQQDLQHVPPCASHPALAAELGELSVSPLGAPSL